MVVVGALAVGVVMQGGLGLGSLAAANTDKEGKSGKDGKDGKKPPVPLVFNTSEVVAPSLTRLPRVVEFSGPLIAPNTAVVRAKAPGTLLTLSVVEGDRVRAGQRIGEIDLAELDSRSAERAANVASARAALELAQRTHRSNERLAAQSFISAHALENSRAQLASAGAGVQAAQAALATSQVGVREAALIAPIAGIVAKRHVLPGEKVAPEQALLTLVDLARLELVAGIASHEVALLTVGMPVQLRIEGQPQADVGTLTRIAPAAEPGSRSIAITVGIANKPEKLRAGQYALGQVTLSDSAERLTLPLAALGQTAGQDLVWLIERGVLARRVVTLGRRDEATARVEVLTGVQPDSQVLAMRFDNLREGHKASVAALGAAKALPVAAAAAASAPVSPK